MMTNYRAKNDFEENVEEISSLLKTLEDKRRDNLTDGLTSGLQGVDPTDYFPGYLLTNLTEMEINRVRKAATEVLAKRDQFYRTSTTSGSIMDDTTNNQEEEE